MGSLFLQGSEGVLSQFRDDKSLRAIFHASAKRGFEYIDTIKERHAAQWKFYHQVRILNPRNLPEMDHDVTKYDALPLPLEDPEFLSEWRKYCRIEDIIFDSASPLVSFWEKRPGVMGSSGLFLANVPVTSADVERSFSLAGAMDTKLRHALPDETRKLTSMLMFNGDIEQRFPCV